MPDSNILDLTHVQLRQLIKNSGNLVYTFKLFDQLGILDKAFARVFSREFFHRVKGKIKKCGSCPNIYFLTLHHKIPLEREISVRTVLDINNLEVLCKSCHDKMETKRNLVKKEKKLRNILSLLDHGVTKASFKSCKVTVTREIIENEELLNIYLKAFRQGWGKRNRVGKLSKPILQRKDKRHKKLIFQIKKIKETELDTVDFEEETLIKK